MTSIARKAVTFILLSLVSLLTTSATAWAVPLSMKYSITSLGGDQYQYDFKLTLDNNDGTWVAGTQWDWIVFGDNSHDDSYYGFDVNGMISGGPDWTTISSSASISIGSTAGAHNGPTVYFGSDFTFPGWQPGAIGEFLMWSGTSGVLIPDGQLVWSSLRVGDTAGQRRAGINFETARQVNIPAPATLALFGLGLAGLGLARRKKV